MADATLLYDGSCRVCSGWAEFVSKSDPKAHIELVAQESEDGRALLTTLPESMQELDSIFLRDAHGRWFAKSAASIRILLRLRFPWPLGAILWLVPRPLRDLAYDAYARRRV